MKMTISYSFFFSNLFSPDFNISPCIAESKVIEPSSQKDQDRELWNPFQLLYSKQGKPL